METIYGYFFGQGDLGAGPAFGQPQPNDIPAQPAHSSQPRTCRICLDTTTLLVDPELGRLMSPCKCKGSSRYVHEECLRLWRTQAANDSNYYKCPTCKFEYRLQRLTWARVVASSATQIAITIAILLITVYLLGFIGDRLIDLYANPWSYTTSFWGIPGLFFGNGYGYGYGYQSQDYRKPLFNKEKVSFAEHMLRGLTSLGLLGFAKVLFVVPREWIRVSLGQNNGRPAAGGRDRVGQLVWIVILIGVVQFLVVVWKYVRRKTKAALDGIAEGVMDVQGDEEQAEPSATGNNDAHGTNNDVPPMDTARDTGFKED